MKNNATKKTDVFLIDPRNIVVVDGFNVRRDFDLDELKEQIKAKGVLNPLTVIAFKDANGEEKYKLVDGERRYRATMLAIGEGADIPFVKALKGYCSSISPKLFMLSLNIYIITTENKNTIILKENAKRNTHSISFFVVL